MLSRLHSAVPEVKQDPLFSIPTSQFSFRSPTATHRPEQSSAVSSAPLTLSQLTPGAPLAGDAIFSKAPQSESNASSTSDTQEKKNPLRSRSARISNPPGKKNPSSRPVQKRQVKPRPDARDTYGNDTMSRAGSSTTSATSSSARPNLNTRIESSSAGRKDVSRNKAPFVKVRATSTVFLHVQWLLR